MDRPKYVTPFSERVDYGLIALVERIVHNAIEARDRFIQATRERADRERMALWLEDWRGYACLLPFTLMADTMLGYTMLVGIVSKPIAWLLSLFMGAGAIAIELIAAHLKEKPDRRWISAVSTAFGLMVPIGLVLMVLRLRDAVNIVTHGRMAGGDIKILLFGGLAVVFHLLLLLAGKRVRLGFIQIRRTLLAYQAGIRVKHVYDEYTDLCREVLFFHQQLMEATEGFDARNPDNTLKRPVYDPITQQWLDERRRDAADPPDGVTDIRPSSPRLTSPNANGQPSIPVEPELATKDANNNLTGQGDSK